MPFIRITITQISEQPTHSLNEELQWFGASLGLFNLRDKDKSRFRIFIALLKGLKQKKGLSSDELAFALALSRATVIHHLNSLMEAGIVSNMRGKYVLNVSTMEELVELTQRNLNKAFDDLKGIARDIDKKMEL